MNTHDLDKNYPEWMHLPATAASLGMTEEELHAMARRRRKLDAAGISEDALRQRAIREILVLLDVEFCGETYFGFPGMQAGAFEA